MIIAQSEAKEISEIKKYYNQLPIKMGSKYSTVTPSAYVLVFLVVSFPLVFPPITYMHSPSSPSMLHVLPISSSSTSSF
jgi:hypothetical protein